MILLESCYGASYFEFGLLLQPREIYFVRLSFEGAVPRVTVAFDADEVSPLGSVFANRAAIDPDRGVVT